MKKLSIILPIYNINIDLYKRAISSVINLRDFKEKNIELIIINDGSFNSEDLYKNTPKLENIIYLKNEINMGASLSREKAIKISSGEYIGFLDGDDFLTEKYNNICSSLNGADIYIKKTNKYLYWMNPNIFVKNDFIKKNDITYNNHLNLYKNFYEDLHFYLKCIVRTNNIEKIDYNYYFYNRELCQNSQSIKNRDEKIRARYVQVVFAIDGIPLNDGAYIRKIKELMRFNKILSFKTLEKILVNKSDEKILNIIKKYSLPKMYYRPWNIMYFIKSWIIKKKYNK